MCRIEIKTACKPLLLFYKLSAIAAVAFLIIELSEINAEGLILYMVQ